WTPLVAPPSSTKPSDRPQDAIASRSGESPAPRQAVLSRIRWIRFFSRDEGVAVGEGTGADPSGAFSTVDGGKSWQPLPGRVSPGWFAAEFVRPDAGILVGANGSRALAVDGKIVVPPRFERLGVRGLHDVALQGESSGWLVGDGGL